MRGQNKITYFKEHQLKHFDPEWVILTQPFQQDVALQTNYINTEAHKVYFMIFLKSKQNLVFDYKWIFLGNWSRFALVGSWTQLLLSHVSSLICPQIEMLK